MKKISTYWLPALAGGFLLALMIDYNSLMAKHSTPLFASWVAHGVGSVASLVFIALFSNLFVKNKETKQYKKGPFWAYLGGIPGALTVVLAAITVNSRLGLSSTLALMLVGQIIFGLVSDIFGLFGTPKRDVMLIDFFVVLSVLTGSGIIIFLRS